MPAALQDGGEVDVAPPPLPPKPLQEGGDIPPPPSPAAAAAPPPPPPAPAEEKPAVEKPAVAAPTEEEKAAVAAKKPLQEGGEVQTAQKPLQEGGEVTTQDTQSQIDALKKQSTDEQGNANAQQMVENLAKQPKSDQLDSAGIDAIKQAIKDKHYEMSTDEWVGRTAANIAGGFFSPGTWVQAGKFAQSIGQAPGILAKLATGQPLNPQDNAVLATLFGGGETADESMMNMTKDAAGHMISKDPTGILRQLYQAAGGKLDDTMRSMEEISKLPEDQWDGAIQAKLEDLRSREAKAQEHLKGTLWDDERQAYKALTGRDMATAEEMAKSGVTPDPEAVAGVSSFVHPMNFIIPGLGEIAGPVTGGLGHAFTGGLLEDAGTTLGGVLKGTQPLERAFQASVKKVAGLGVEGLLDIGGLTHVPFPLNLVFKPQIDALSHWAGRIAGAAGERLGGIPQILRENLWEPGADIIRQTGQDMRTGGSGLEAKYGPAGQLFGGAVKGAVTGTVGALPFTMGAQTPEEAGQTIGGGMALGAVTHLPAAGMDAAMSSVFHRAGRLDTVMPDHGDYGTTYGTPGNEVQLDQAHNDFVASLPPAMQTAINNLRQWFPNIEIYVTDKKNYQNSIQSLQNSGILGPENLKSRGVNMVTDPKTGKAMVLIDGEARYNRGSILDTAHHEIGHSIYRWMQDKDPEAAAAFRNAGANHFDMDDLTKTYTRRIAGGDGYKYTDLPTEAEIKSGAKQFLPGLEGITKETMNEELGAETVAALLHGEPLQNFERDPSRFRNLQMAFGRALGNLGMDITPENATTILGVRSGFDKMFVMDKIIRDYMRENPGNKGAAAAAVPEEGGGPKPSKGKKAPTVTNNQPSVGGGKNGAPQEEVDAAVRGLQGLGFRKGQAQEMVNNASGKTADELLQNALQRQGGGRAVLGEAKAPATPQEAKAAEAPVFPHPLERHRIMPTEELARRAVMGDAQAKQTLIERHGNEWLEHVKDQDVVGMHRRLQPEDAQAQQARIDARSKAQVDAEERAAQEGRPAPKPVDAARIAELRAKAEREVPRVGYMPAEEEELKPRKFRNAAEHEAAINQRHIHLVMGEHDRLLAPGDRRVRLQIDPDTGRRLYNGTHFDLSDPVHQWLLGRMDPDERTHLLWAQRAIANGENMTFNYTHAPRMGRKWLPSAPEREAEIRAAPAELRATGEESGQVGTRTFMPISVGVGADGQGLTYGMAIDKVLANAIKADRAMRGKTPYGKISRATLPNLLDDMRKVGENHRAGWKGDGSAPLVGTNARPVNVNPRYVPSLIPPEHAQFVNMLMNARDTLRGPRVTKEGKLTAAGKALEFAEANQGYTSRHVSRGMERTEVNPMREALEKKGAFAGRELEHGYEQFRTDLMRGTRDRAPALRKHGLQAEAVKGPVPERRYAAAGFMPVEEGAITPEEFIRHRDESSRPGFLSPITPDELRNHRLFTMHAGRVGAALSPEGDIQNVYNNGGPKGDAAYVLAHAIEQGGRTLDCYDHYLPKLYRQFGMKETGRMTFNPEFAPQGWDFSSYGTPDVVFMGWSGYPEGSPERAIARAKGNRDDWIPNDRAQQREEDWDAAKGRSQAYSRGEAVPGVAPEGERPPAIRAGEAARPGPGEAGRRPVGYMPPEEDEQQQEATRARLEREGVGQYQRGGRPTRAHGEKLARYLETLARSPDTLDSKALDDHYKRWGDIARVGGNEAHRLLTDATSRGELLGPMNRPPDAGGGEHDLWFDNDGERMTKEAGRHDGFGYVPIIDDPENPYGLRGATPYEYLKRLALAREHFGQDIRLEGMVHWPDRGILRIRTSEPRLGESKSPSQEEADNYMFDHGFKPNPKILDNWQHPSGTTAVDVVPKNFVYDDEGNVRPVDVMLRRDAFARAEPIATPEAGGRSVEDQALADKGPATPGSKVGYMPPEEEEPAPKKGKKAPPPRIAPRELRDEFITPEERAVLDKLKEDGQRVLQKYQEQPTSAAAESLGERRLPAWAKFKEKVGEYFTNKNPTLDFNNPDHRQNMALALVHDILRRIISHPDSYGWYRRNVQAAMQEIGKLNPRIADDPVHNLVMRLCLAVTSQDQKVHPNFESAYRAYLYWNRTGLFPEEPGKGRDYFGGGTKADAMEKNFAKLNRLWQDYKVNETGHESLEEQLRTKLKIRDIDKIFGTDIDEPKDYETEFSAILGPKIGSFFNNLSGIYHTLTSDVWATRTFNRLAGKMMAFGASKMFRNPDPKKTPYLTGLRNAIADGTMENASKAQQKQMLKEAGALDRYKDNPDALDRDTAIELAPTIRQWASEQHGRFAANTPDPTGKVRSFWDKRPINYLAKNIDNNFSELEGGPRSPAEREAFRDIMQRALGMLAAEGIHITAADAQAVVWYMEQDIFSWARYGRGDMGSYDYLDASYALRHKYAGQTPNEFGEVPEPEEAPSPAPKAKQARAPPKAARMPGGPEAPTERREPMALPVPRLAVQQPQPAKPLPQEQVTPGDTMAPEVKTETQPPPPRLLSAQELGLGQRPPPPSVQQPVTSAGPGPQPVDFSKEPPAVGPNAMLAATGKPPVAFIMHHTGGGTLESTIQTLKERGLGVEYIMDRDGSIHVAGQPGAANILPGWGTYGQGLNNKNIVGMEVVAKDNNDVTPAQVAAAQQFIRENYPNTPVFGHGEVNPGHKEADEGLKIASAIRAERAGQQQPGAIRYAGGGGPDTSRAALASAASIMREEGPSDVQDGRREVFGFREGIDSEYPEMTRLRGAGDEEGIRRLATQGLVQRAIEAGSRQLNDVGLKAQLMSLAHMRGVSGARAILNAAGTGRLDNSGGADQLDPRALAALNGMDRATALRRINLARTYYDQAILDRKHPGFWSTYGTGLTNRYAREEQLYAGV